MEEVTVSHVLCFTHAICTHAIDTHIYVHFKLTGYERPVNQIKRWVTDWEKRVFNLRNGQRSVPLTYWCSHKWLTKKQLSRNKGKGRGVRFGLCSAGTPFLSLFGVY